jgi:hypothetical protein
MKAGRIVLLVFGIIFVLISFGLLVGGGVILAVDNGFKDSEGYYSTGMVPISAASTAIISQPADFEINTGWFFRSRSPLSIKIEAENLDPSKPVFIGVARQSDLNSYINGLSYDEVTGFDVWPDHIEHIHYPGNAVAPAPADQKFWIASASGTGTQTLRWDVTSGTYSVIYMNADGTSPVHGDITLAAKIPQVVHSLGIGLLVGGIVLIVGGGVMIFFAIRGW